MAVAVTVELYLSGAWVDVTADVFVEAGINIHHGISAEGNTADPATCTLSLDNRDGVYSPRNPSSPYYGDLGRNTELRVLVDGAVRFSGEVSEWPSRWDVAGAVVQVPVTASGILRRLSQGQRALRSAIYSEFVETFETHGEIVGYWPFEDSEGSETLASAIGGAAATFTGSPAFAASAPAPASGPIPTWVGATATAHASGEVGSNEVLVGALVAIPEDGTADGAELLRVYTSGTIYYLSVSWAGVGSLRTRAFLSDGTVVLDQSVSFGFIDDTKYLTLVAANNGADVDWRTSVIPTLDDSTSTTFNGTILGQSVTSPVAAIINPASAITGDVAIGHVVLGNDVDALFKFGAYRALRAWIDEHAAERIDRLGTESAVAVAVVTGSSTEPALGPQQVSTLLDIALEAESADRGILHDAKDFLGLRYVQRSALYSDQHAAPLELDYAAGHLSPPLEPVDDDRLLANDVTVSRSDGSSARAVQESGPLSVQAPPDGVGIYDVGLTLNVADDAALPDLAGWALHQGTIDEARYPSVTVDLVKNSALSASVGALDVGDWIRLVNLPSWLPPEEPELVVLGWSESISSHTRLVTFNCAPASQYRVATVESSEFGRLDSTTTVTAEALDTTETDVDYSGDTWVTTATHPAEFPFDIAIGGEVMTVTAATSSTFTVTRSVNGVVKSHAIGAQIRLASPARLAL